MTALPEELAHLSEPPPLPDGALRVVPLGGLGEIGRNMTVFEHRGALLVVDCGVLFPEAEQPGVDLILPDFSWLRSRLDDVAAIVLTHGHEDHIGGVPYLLREKPDIPLIGSRFTLALIEAKLKEHRIRPYTLEVREGQRERLGPFEAEFLAVNHSIPDALAVVLRSEAGTVLHTGDFKMDQLPLDGRLTDLGGFARVGAEGLDLLLVDSTNADVPGFVTPERDIGPVLDGLIGRATGKVVTACFASHVHRVQQVLDAAARHGRRAAFIGRSMVRNMGVARELGLLDVPEGLLVGVKEVDDLPDDEVVLVSTGSQGEPLAALSRMANGDHPVQVGAGDLVILASSLIPGNETDVWRVVNGLTRQGATVVHKGVAQVHVSGHAPAGELLYLFNLARPRNVLPVHGEARHLHAAAALARLTGVPDERVVLAEDGIVVDLVDGRAAVTGRVEAGYVYVHGTSVGEVSEDTLKDRLVLGEEGFVAVTAVVDVRRGSVVAGPFVTGKGFSEDADVFSPVVPRARRALEEALADGVQDGHALQQRLRRAVGSWVGGELRRRPMIVPTVLVV